MKHQRKLRETKPQSTRGFRHENAEPAQLGGLPQPVRREGWLLSAKSTGHLGTGFAGKFRRAVAQNTLFGCQQQFHERQLGRFSTRRAMTLRWISLEPL